MKNSKNKIRIMKKTIYGFTLWRKSQSVWSGSHYTYDGSYFYTTEEERDKEMEEYLSDADYLVEIFEKELEF